MLANSRKRENTLKSSSENTLTKSIVRRNTRCNVGKNSCGFIKIFSHVSNEKLFHLYMLIVEMCRVDLSLNVNTYLRDVREVSGRDWNLLAYKRTHSRSEKKSLK